MHLDRPPRLFMAPLVGGRRRAGGFTLIELMITVAIVGILAAVAYPSYKSSILKGRRAEGRTALIDLAQQQERYMTQNGAYLDFASAATGVPFKTYSGDNLSSAAYKLSAAACGTLSLKECVKLTATPTRVNSDLDYGDLTLTSTGLKSCTNATRAAAGTCW